MARFGVLTGGGDCPGLNAVIRAIVRAGSTARPRVLRLSATAGRACSRARAIELTAETRAGSCTAAGRSSGPRGRTRTRRRTGSSACAPRWTQHRLDGADPDRRRGHARRRRAAVRGRRRRGRRPEDDRQRPRRHRLHVRLPDRGPDRHRRDRPPAHDGGVAQPRDRRRGDGAHRGLDRVLLGDGRRRRRDPRARAAVRHRGGLRAGPPPPRERPLVLDRRGRRGGDAEGRRRQVRVRGRDGRLRPRPPGRDRGPARARDRGAHRLRVAHDDPRPRPARRHAARLRPRARHALRGRRDRRGGRRATSARWSRCAGPRSSWCRSTRRWPSRSCWTRGCSRRPRCSSGSFRTVFKQGPVPAYAHGIIEYLAAILFIAAPFIFKFDDDTATAVSLIVGVIDPDHRRVDGMEDRADQLDPGPGPRDARLRARDLPDRRAVRARVLRRRHGRGVLHRDRRDPLLLTIATRFVADEPHVRS